MESTARGEHPRADFILEMRTRSRLLYAYLTLWEGRTAVWIGTVHRSCPSRSSEARSGLTNQFVEPEE
jgi:hypothetical protein